jgi:FkbM family methyltransferase
VGAYLGGACIPWAQMYPEAQVYGIEACPNNFELLSKKSKDIANFSACHYAVSDTTGTIDFFVSNRPDSKGSSPSNSLFKNYLEQKSWARKSLEKISVPSVTLDDFCQDHKIDKVDLLAFNCEGGEFKIFDEKSPLHFLDFTRIIVLELHGKSSGFVSEEYTQKKKDICVLLRRKGFELKGGSENFHHKKHVLHIWCRDN